VSVSVVIPTLNEGACLGETLQLLRLQQPQEIIVADSGSRDDTQKLARAADRLIVSARGRAAQMNAGAAAATGSVLLFLHADCMLEDGALNEAERLLQQQNVAAGCFRMTVRDSRRIFRLIDWCATARVRWTGLVYGDQGLFIRRQLFERLGGFPPVSFLEDVCFSKTLRRQGRIVAASKHIHVSARRWRRQGVIGQTLRNWTLTVLAAAGVHPDRLAAFYPAVR
jgi:rSAM/selenodomain-associated transferase 2